jgi:hypothetical protein
MEKMQNILQNEWCKWSLNLNLKVCWKLKFS